MSSFIAFDLEGPLSPNDNAYDLMGLFPNGRKVFEIISRYDDLLTLAEKPGYEPGDTLALIVPFLVLHGITEADITRLAGEARLIPGTADLISRLLTSDWRVFCITTTYEQYALHLTHKVSIYAHNVACTPFPLDRLRQSLCQEESNLLQQTEQTIISLDPSDDNRIRQALDKFFWEQLPQTEVGKLISEVNPVGGRRKTVALQRFAEKYGEPLSRWVAVGDSITDCRMLTEVDRQGGLAIAFNANQFALPCATMSLASTNISDLTDVLQAWKKGLRKETSRVVLEKEKRGGTGDRAHFHWLVERNKVTGIDDVKQIHRRIRQLVRESAGNLG